MTILYTLSGLLFKNSIKTNDPIVKNQQNAKRGMIVYKFVIRPKKGEKSAAVAYNIIVDQPI